MSRPIFRWAALLQLGLTVFAGCHPTQPFFVNRDESRALYLEQALGIEYADVHVESLPEATQSHAPFGPNNLPTEFFDLSLEDCIIIALQNTKIIRVVNGSNLQSGSVVTPLLSAAPGTMPSIYDPALVATTTNPQPIVVDGQGNRINPRGAALANQVGGVEDALSEFDAQFSSLFGYNTTDRPRNVADNNPFNPQFFQAVDANAQAALSKRLATGTIATARTTTVYSRNNIPAPSVGRFVPSDYTTAFEMQVTQPLLRGRGTLVNRIPIVLARMNEDVQLQDFEANIRNLVKSVEDAYWDLYCGYRAVETAKNARDSALTFWRIAEDRFRVGAEGSGPEAEAQARSLVEQFESQITIALSGTSLPGFDPLGLYGREQVLRERLGLPPTDGRLIRPTDEPTEARVLFDWNQVKTEALVRSPELRRQKWAIKQRELELISAKNQILAQLDATVFYRWLGVGDNLASSDETGIDFPNPGSNAIEELFDGDYQEVGARIELTPPAIGKRRALATIQNRRMLLKKFEEELREKEVFVINQATTSERILDSTYKSINDFRRQLQADKDEIQIYDDLIRGGTSRELGQLANLLLQAEQRRARSQLQYYQAICEYNKAIVNVHYVKGSLLDLNSIDLGEGPWVDKAYWDAEERAAERASGAYFDYGYTRPGVVSQGPVQSGGLTEGNISDPRAGEAQRLRGQTVPDEDADDNGDATDGEDRPELPAPTAGRARGAVNFTDSTSIPSAVQPASAPVTVPQSSQTTSRPDQQAVGGFDWGALETHATNQATIATSSGQRRSISDSNRASGQNAGKPPTRMQSSTSSSGSGSVSRPIRVISTGNATSSTSSGTTNTQGASSPNGQWQPRR